MDELPNLKKKLLIVSWMNCLISCRTRAPGIAVGSEEGHLKESFFNNYIKLFEAGSFLSLSYLNQLTPTL